MDMPRLEKGAIWSLKSIPPTPITSSWSAGLFSVPQSGPSLPMALIMMMPLATISSILSVNG